jgi:hypothetical protein
VSAFGRAAPRTQGDERGIALGVAVLSLFVVGTLMSTAVLVALGESRMSHHWIRFEQARDAAVMGAYHPLVAWQPSAYRSIAVGDTVMYRGAGPVGGSWFSGTVRRVSRRVFSSVSRGRDASERTRAGFGVYLILRAIDVDVEAAVTARGPIALGAQAQLSGRDAVPIGWQCGAPQPSLPAIRVPASDTTPLDFQCASLSCVGRVRRSCPD